MGSNLHPDLTVEGAYQDRYTTPIKHNRNQTFVIHQPTINDGWTIDARLAISV
jgi:hypothetical protein